MWDLENSLKLISSKNQLLAGTSSRAISVSNSSLRAISSAFFLWGYKWDIAEDPLGVQDMKYFWDELLSPVSGVEEAARHGQVEVLYFIEMCWNVPFYEVTTTYHVLALCQSLHTWGHCSQVCKGFVALHQNVLGYPVCQFLVRNAAFLQPLSQFVCIIDKQLSSLLIWAKE